MLNSYNFISIRDLGDKRYNEKGCNDWTCKMLLASLGNIFIK